MKTRRTNPNADGPKRSRGMGFLAAMLFAVPTAAVIWFAASKSLALWTDLQPSLGGFLILQGGFALVALFLPELFPTLFGKVWQALIKFSRWFG